jgi:hypothetical protein
MDSGRFVLPRLTSLAPEIVERILDGDEPEGMSLAKLRTELPVVWWEQVWDESSDVGFTHGGWQCNAAGERTSAPRGARTDAANSHLYFWGISTVEDASDGHYYSARHRGRCR